MIRRLLAVTIFVLAGCSDVMLKPDAAQSLLVSATARAIGYKLAESDPGFAAPAKVFCASLVAGDIDKAVIDAAKQFLIEKTKADPLLAASVADLAGLLQFDTGEYNTALVKTAAAAMTDGITLYELSAEKRH